MVARLAGDSLFTCEWAFEALTRPCVGLGTLTSERQTLTVTEATVATEIHQTLDVHRHFPPQVTFHIHLGDQRTQLIQLTL